MNTDDPKFTAYALGEVEDLTPEERAEIEALLASDATAAVEAEEMRALAGTLRAELPGEAASALLQEQRAAVLAAALDVTPGHRIVRFPRRATLAAAIAACLVVAASLALFFAPERGLRGEAKFANNSTADAQMLSWATKSEAKPVAIQRRGELADAGPAPQEMSRGKTTATPFPVVTTAPIETSSLFITSRKSNEQIAQLWSEAEGFYQTGRLELSKKRAEQILAADPYNLDAGKLIEKVDRRVSDFGVATYNETRSGGIAQVDLAWQRPIRRFALEPGGSRMTSESAGTSTPAAVAVGQVIRNNSPVSIRGQAALLDESPVPFTETPTTPTAFDTRISDRSTTEDFDALSENDFLTVAQNPLSTFSIDVDSASYSIVRRFLTQNQRPPRGAVRFEELLNYFTYDYAPPRGDAPFSAAMEATACPWNPEHRLVRIGLKGREIAKDKRPASNLVFLIDVSGSMQPQNKLPLLQRSLGLLVDQLGAEDRVAIVVYAGSSGCVLEPTNDKAEIRAALERLQAGGSTNGASGLRLAYDLAKKSFIKGGTNRVILATDGDWNVGVTNQSDLLDLIAQQAKSGVFLTVLGFGMGNLNDSMMVKLADRGNGNYAYLDTLAEAKKVLVEQLSGTLVTIAKDVKIQVEFNPAQVAAYRLIGYEKRVLAKEDFNDDKKDAGEIGAGHTVTALYEVVPVGKPLFALEKSVDALKYQPTPGATRPLIPERAPQDAHPEPIPPHVPATPVPPAESAPQDAKPYLLGQANGRPTNDAAIERFKTADGRVEKEGVGNTPALELQLAAKNDTVSGAIAGRAAIPDVKTKAIAAVAAEMLTLKLRYKEPEGNISKLLEFPLTDAGAPWERSSRDLRFAAAVAGFGLLLRDSAHKGEMTWGAVAEWAQEGLGADANGYRAEFLTLIEKAKAVTR